MKPAFKDPYLYSRTNVLINKYNLTDPHLLEMAESYAFQKRLDSGIPEGNFDYDHLKKIHYHIFQDIYEWAGKERTIGISKGDSMFASPPQIKPYLNNLFAELVKEHYLANISFTNFCERASYYFSEINAVHPFREGNGRTQRLFLDKLVAHTGYKIAWNNVDRDSYLRASISSFRGDRKGIKEIFLSIIQTAGKSLSLVGLASLQSSKMPRTFGQAKNSVTIAPDFNDSLEDFKGYER